MSNVTTLLDAKSVPEAKAALVCPSRNETYSYLKLREEMNRIGSGLSHLGIRKGDRVCIYLDSSPEYLISYFAIWRIGAVAVPTNIVYREEELLHAVSDAGASAIITDVRGFCVVADVQKRRRPLPISSAWVETAQAAAPISSHGSRFLRRLHPCGRPTARWMTSAISSTRPARPVSLRVPCSPMATG